MYAVRMVLVWLIPACLAATAADSPSMAKPARADAGGDPLPPGAIARFGSKRLRHGGQISCMALSPDKKTLVSGELGQYVHVWDTATGKELKRINANLGWIYQVAFSPDGKLFAASAAGNWLPIWDRTTFKEVQTLKHDSSHIHAFAFSPDNKTLISCGDDLRPILWDVQSGKILHRLKGPTAAVLTWAFSRNGQTVAAGGIDKMVRIWDTVSGRVLAVLPQKRRVEWVVFSPDGKTLAVKENERGLGLWDLCSQQMDRRFQVPVFTFDVLAFSPDSKTLAAGTVDEKNILRLWDSATGKECPKLKGDYHAMPGRAISTDGKMHVRGYADRAMQIHDAEGKNLCPLPGHQGPIQAVAFSHDAREVASASYDGTVRLWQSATGKERRRFTMPPAKLTDGWAPPPMFSSLAFSPDGQRLAAASNFGRIRLWDKNLDKLLWEYDRDSVDWVFGVAFSPDGKMLAHGSHDMGVHLLDIAARKEIRCLKGHKSTVDTVLFAPDNKTLISGSRDGDIRLWDWTTGKERSRLRSKGIANNLMALSPDGQTLATGGDPGVVLLWTLPGPDTGAHLETNAGRIEELMFSPDGRMLALGAEGGGLLLFEIATRRLRCRFLGHTGAVQAVAFSRDGRIIVSGSADTSAMVWELWPHRATAPRLSARDLDRLWEALGGTDAEFAFRAIGILQHFPKDTVMLMRERLKPLPLPDPKKVAALIAQLDHPQFKVRQNAKLELEKMDEGALPALQAAQKAKPSLEKARRIQELLARIRETSGKRLHDLRGVEVLEYLNNPEANALLQALSRGAPHARLTLEARQALDRLKANP